MSAVDRLSAMPDSVVQLILSFLPPWEAAKTCTLSKRWKYSWRSVPSLDLDGFYFEERLVNGGRCTDGGHGKPCWRERCRREKIARERFIAMVDHCLFSHRLQLDSFKLRFYPDGDVLWVLERWIHHVVFKERVRELDLCLERCFGFPILSRILSHGVASSLKVLTLTGVYISAESISLLLGNHASLEELELSSCYGAEKVAVVGSNLMLKNFTVKNCSDLESLDLEARNLQFFAFSNYTEFFELHNMPYLSTAKLYIYNDDLDRREETVLKSLRSISNVRLLEVSHCIIRAIHQLEVRERAWLNPFPNLEVLLLGCFFQEETIGGSLTLLDYCNRIKKLTINKCSSVYCYEEEDIPLSHDLWGTFQFPDCLANHLEKVKISCFEGSRCEMEFIKFLLENATCLHSLSLDINFLNVCSIARIAVDLLAMPRRSRHAKITFSMIPNLLERSP